MGWRPDIDLLVERMPGLDWVEVVAENICPTHLPESLRLLRERGLAIVPHGVGLGLGGAGRPDPDRLAALADRTVALGSPLVSEHVAFVRAGSPVLEAGHLLPVPRTREALAVVAENVRIAQDALPVPLALENTSALFAWPEDELTEAQFLAELVERTGVRLLVDVANLHANHVNFGADPVRALDDLPLHAVAYAHIAGGIERDGFWHDTHAHPLTEPVLDVLAALRARTDPPGVLLERDGNYPMAQELSRELDAIRAVLGSGPAEPGATAVPDGARPTTGTPDDTPADAHRPRLARAQGEVLAALTAGAPAPERFDAERLAAASRALAAKRHEVASRIAPEVTEGARQDFIYWARTNPLRGGARADTAAFARHLLARGGLPTARRRALRRRLRQLAPRPAFPGILGRKVTP
ncbi:endonuclease [Streptomyces griseocarneus]|nr:endonuclease [Streptomyces griseocarneus]